MYQVDGSSGRGYYIVLPAKCACMQIKIKKKILYFYKAVMEKEANGGWTRNGCFFELLAGYWTYKLLKLRARFCIVINWELASAAASIIIISFGC